MSDGGILVTGTHRSGTTWCGRMLALAPDVVYIHEPFNVDHGHKAMPARVDRWYAHLDDLPNADEVERAFAAMLGFRFVPPRPLGRVLAPAGLKSIVGWRRRNARLRRDAATPLVKDPLALLSAEPLAERFGLRVVCMVRHPLAFCGSIVRWGWSFPFGDLVKQPRAVERYFPEWRPELERFAAEEKDLTAQAILLWNVLHAAIRRYRAAHGDWVFVRHEDLAGDAVGGFERLFGAVGLPFTDAVRAGINGSVSSGGGETGSALFQARDASRVTSTWKDRLSEDDARRVLDETAELREAFYADDPADPSAA